MGNSQFSLHALELAAFGCMLPVSRKSSVKCLKQGVWLILWVGDGYG